MKIIFIENFHHFKENYENNDNDFVIINISASWCKPCNNIKEELHNFIENFEEKHNSSSNNVFLKIDYDMIEDDDDFTEYFSINKIPYFYIYKNKKQVKEFQTGNIEIIKNEIISHVINNEENNFNLSNDF